MSEQTQSQTTADESDVQHSKPLGWLASFILVMGLLLVLRWSIGKVEPDHQSMLLIGGLSIMLLVPALRLAFVRAMLFSAMLATALIVFNNYESIRKGNISLAQASKEVIQTLTGFGPIQQVVHLRDDVRYGVYLRAVDHKSAQINQLATEVARGCGGADQGCVASRIISYVTTNFEYRSDPVRVFSEGDYVKSPQQTIESAAGDCDDLTILTISLLGSVGVNSYMVFEDSHTYPIVCLKNPIAGPSFIKMNGEHCYALEPTARNSKLGVKKSISNVVAVFEPFNKRRVNFRISQK